MTNRYTPSPTPPPATVSSERVVVGINGSAASEAALQVGIRLSRALGLSVTAITTWQEDDVVLDFPTAGLDYPSEARKSMRRVTGRVFPGAWPPWFQAEVREGDTARVLIEESTAAQFLVIGHSSHRALTRLLYGSTSSFCVTHAHCPVIVVP